MSSDASNVLSAIVLPDSEAKRRYEAMVGIDDIKRNLLAALRVVVNPVPFEAWGQKQRGIEVAVRQVIDRPHLFILGGDVGTGKTELAETIGDALARAERAEVTLFTLSLAARGTGFVGEMTQRIVSAFDQIRVWGDKRKTRTGGRRVGAILFIDEADAVAQSRESAQMHHEDRAGVNALIRGIDDLTRANLPVAILMATNRLSSLDPAVRRRAANTYIFVRPEELQRRTLLSKMVSGLSHDSQFAELVRATGPLDSRVYGFTYSDIVQRLIPEALLQAYEDSTVLDVARLLEVARRIVPTPPFTTTDE